MPILNPQCAVCGASLSFKRTGNWWQDNLLIAREGWWVCPINTVPYLTLDAPIVERVKIIDVAFMKVNFEAFQYQCKQHNAGGTGNITIHCFLS